MSGGYNSRIMEVLDDGRIRCRVRISGTIDGTPFEYTDPEGTAGSQFIHPAGANGNDPENGPDPSTFWWEDGNFACDCNRSMFVPEDLLKRLERTPRGPHEEGDKVACGDRIRIASIVPVEFGPDGQTLSELHLDES